MSLKLRAYVFDTIKVARQNLHQTQERQIRQANKKRREPDFTVGDKIWVDAVAAHTDVLEHPDGNQPIKLGRVPKKARRKRRVFVIWRSRGLDNLAHAAVLSALKKG